MERIKNVKWLWLFTLVIVAILSIWTINNFLSINLESLNYRKSILSESGPNLPAEDLADNHPRKKLWVILKSIQEKDYDRVIELARGEIGTGRNQSLYHLYLGRAYEEKGMIEMAFTEWAESGAEQEIQISAWRLLAQNRAEAAIQIINLALKKWPESSDYPLWIFDLGEGRFIQGKWDLAIQAFYEALAYYKPPYPDLPVELKAQAYINAGSASYSAGKGFEASAELIWKGIHLDPKTSRGYEKLGDILRSEKRSLEAKSLFAEAARRSPTDPSPVAKQVEISMENNQWYEAKALLDSGLNSFPQHAYFYYLLAGWFRHFNNIDSAIQAGKKSIDLAVINLSGYQSNLADLYELGGRYKDALDLCQQIELSDPTNTAAQDCIDRLEKKIR